MTGTPTTPAADVPTNWADVAKLTLHYIAIAGLMAGVGYLVVLGKDVIDGKGQFDLAEIPETLG